MSVIHFPSALVSSSWLEDNLKAENLVILDASVPPIVRIIANGIPREIMARHIPGALRFDYDTQICNKNSNLPHMMPEAEEFAAEVRKLGINNNSAVLIYDDVGIYSSPRAWWMFKAMGHDNVAVLDGGAVGWFSSGLPMTEKLLMQASTAGNFRSSERSDYFCDAMEVYQLLNDDSVSILDARSEGRFNGRDPEPRAGLRGGHMPNALNLPFQKVLNDIYMKPVEELKQLMSELANPEQKLVFTCGSGLSACILTLAAELAGFDQLSVYDGSWCDWASQSKLPVVTS